jgi:hypothetical protein
MKLEQAEQLARTCQNRAGFAYTESGKLLWDSGAVILGLIDAVEGLQAQLAEGATELRAEQERRRAEIRTQLAARVPEGWRQALCECVELLEFLEPEVRGGYSPDGALAKAKAVLSAAPSQQAPVQGEPVAWLEQVTLSSGGYSPPTKEWRVTQNPSTSKAPRKPLYLHQQQASKPMTDREVMRGFNEEGYGASYEEFCRGVRFAERHHKIGEKQ